jgi:uncharacterized cupredoxin-like copper-binding protein
MKLSRADRQVLGTGAALFTFFAMLFAFAAVVVAGQAWSRSNEAKDRVAKLVSGQILGNNVKVALQEYILTPTPTEVKSGKVRVEADNNGTITHETVVVRAPSAEALPKTVAATSERSVGSIAEEAIPESDKVGETGDIAAGAKKTLTLNLTPGTYTLFCNIDVHAPDGTVVNHFHRGMHATLVVK